MFIYIDYRMLSLNNYNQPEAESQPNDKLTLISTVQKWSAYILQVPCIKSSRVNGESL